MTDEYRATNGWTTCGTYDKRTLPCSERIIPSMYPVSRGISQGDHSVYIYFWRRTSHRGQSKKINKRSNRSEWTQKTTTTTEPRCRNAWNLWKQNNYGQKNLIISFSGQFFQKLMRQGGFIFYFLLLQIRMRVFIFFLPRCDEACQSN